MVLQSSALLAIVLRKCATRLAGVGGCCLATKADSVLQQQQRSRSASLVTMEINNELFKSLFTDELLALRQLFASSGHELRLAGGAVRDLASDKRPHDLDFATTATPDEMVRLFESNQIRMINANGLSHGTVTVRINDAENFEITTLRVDTDTDGRHAKVEFTKDWQLDASRRDLTMNSMFLDLDGKLYDYFNGLEDLRQRRVRFVGDAGERIREDYLRILRYFRFFARVVEPGSCGKQREHEPETLAAIRQNAAGLAGIAGERLWMEFKQILAGRYPASIVQAMVDCNCTQYLGFPARPQVEELLLVRPEGEEDEDEDEGSRARQLHHASCLAALLGDDAALASVHKRLRLSNEEQSLAAFIIRHRAEARAMANHQACFGHYRDLIVLNPDKEANVRMKTRQLLLYCNRLELVEELDAWKQPKLPTNGRDIAQRWRLNLQGGHKRLLGQIIHQLMLDWRDSGYTASREQLLDESARSRICAQFGIDEATGEANDDHGEQPPDAKLSKR